MQVGQPWHIKVKSETFRYTVSLQQITETNPMQVHEILKVQWTIKEVLLSIPKYQQPIVEEAYQCPQA